MKAHLYCHGNVRELENLLERIFILEDDDVLQRSRKV